MTANLAGAMALPMVSQRQRPRSQVPCSCATSASQTAHRLISGQPSRRWSSVMQPTQSPQPRQPMQSAYLPSDASLRGRRQSMRPGWEQCCSRPQRRPPWTAECRVAWALSRRRDRPPLPMVDRVAVACPHAQHCVRLHRWREPATPTLLTSHLQRQRRRFLPGVPLPRRSGDGPRWPRRGW